MPFFVDEAHQHDDADHRHHVDVAPRDEQRERHADEAQRQREHDRERLEERAEERRENQVDEDDGEHQRLEHVALGLVEVLHVAAEHGVIARRKAERVDRLLDVVRHVAHG